MNLVEELKKAGIEVPEEIAKKYAGEFVSKAEMDKKIEKAAAETKEATERAEVAEKALKGFEGKDYEGIKSQLEEAQNTIKSLKETQKAEAAEREKEDLLKASFSKYEFTSEAAKQAIYNDIKSNVTVKDGQLIGFSDLMSAKQKSDAGAFVSKAEQSKAKFTQSFQNTAENKGITNKKDFVKSLGSVRSATERQNLIRDNIALFVDGQANE